MPLVIIISLSLTEVNIMEIRLLSFINWQLNITE